MSQKPKPIPEDDVVKGLDFEMIYEANRLKSYVNWPFKDGTCTKERVNISNC